MNQFLKNILDGINMLFNNYGWSIIVFTLLIKLVLMPFDYKSRVGMRKTSRIQPQIAALQKKYANDKEKLNAKTAELYKKEGVNPLASCLPMLLTFPILIAMFNAMRMVANEHLVQQAFDLVLDKPVQLEGWLWIKNLWMPDSPFATQLPDVKSLTMVPADIWQKAINALSEADLSALMSKVQTATGAAFSSEAFTTDLKGTVTALHETMKSIDPAAFQPTTISLFNRIFVYRELNGWFLLPLMSAGSQFLMSSMNPTQPAADQQQASTGNFMKWFFPLFTLWLCFSYTAAFALYWVASNLIAMVQTWGINKYLDAKDKKAANVVTAEGKIK